MLDRIKKQVAEMARRQEEKEAREDEARRAEKDMRERIASADRTAAKALAEVMRGVGLIGFRVGNQLMTVLAVIPSPSQPGLDKTPNRIVAVLSERRAGIGSPIFSGEHEVGPRFVVDVSPDGHDVWIVHDDDRVSYEVAVGIIADSLDALLGGSPS